MGQQLLAAAFAPCEAKVLHTGDSIEIWSASLHGWFSGRVFSVQEDTLEVEFFTAEGKRGLKQVPQGCDQIRCPAPRPLPGPDHYQVGDAIETWSQSQNAWRCGHIKSILGTMAEIESEGPDG